MSRRAGHSLMRRVLIGVVALALLIGTVVAWRDRDPGARTVTATFASAVNIHEGDEVRVLGVPVGRVLDVQPSGSEVRVTMTYDDDIALSAQATAAVVTPTLVSVRYIQLGPVAASSASDGGADVLPDDATIPLARTAVPVEWDQIKTELNDLSTALGPDGANKDGALSRLLKSTATNVAGQGASLRDTLAGLARAVETLSTGRGDVFAAVRNLQVFIAALRASDAQVAQFNRRLARVSTVLADNRDDLSTTLGAIDRSAEVITRFLNRNRDRLTVTVRDLRDITTNLARSRQALADLLHRVPTALSNLHNIYDPFSGAVTTSLAATNFNDPAQFVCDIALLGAPGGVNSPQAIEQCQTALGPLLDLVRVPGPSQLPRSPKEDP